LLETGFADNWQDILFEAIGVRDMDGSAIKEYFTPLTSYLQAQRALHQYPLDWKMNAFEDYYQNTTVHRHKRAAGDKATEFREDKITTGLIIVGIIQGSAIVLAMGGYIL